MAWWEQTSDCQEESSPTTNLDLAHRYAMFLCPLDVQIYNIDVDDNLVRELTTRYPHLQVPEMAIALEILFVG